MKNTYLMLILLLAYIGFISAGCSSSDAQENNRTDPEVAYLFALTASSGSAENGVLTLTGLPSHVIAFSDRPLRLVTRFTAADFFTNWETMFRADPPNTALSFNIDNNDRLAILELTNAVYDADSNSVVFDYQILGGHQLMTEFTQASLFIDSWYSGIEGFGEFAVDVGAMLYTGGQV